MKDARGDVLYVGKAQSLRSRVRSYWQKQAPGGEIHRIRQVIDRVVDVEITETDSVSEALLLEANLIKRFQPRFNVRLKDDKSYPYIKITPRRRLPAHRAHAQARATTGAATSGRTRRASSVDESMNLVRRLFPFRTCTIEIKDGERALQRPCLLYHIKRCQGPCIEAISKDDYRADIAQVELFLEGRQETLAKALRTRDGARPPTPSNTSERQPCGTRSGRSSGRWRARRWPRSRGPSWTSWGWPARTTRRPSSCSSSATGSCSGATCTCSTRAKEATDDEVLVGFLEQYYTRATVDPARDPRPDAAGRRHGRDGSRGLPRRAARWAGPPSRRRSAASGAKLMDAGDAATPPSTLAREQARWLADQGKTLGALEELADGARPAGTADADRVLRHLATSRAARRSASMVVFEEGRPRTGEYRRFRIRTVSGPNDFASHQEILRRRFRGPKPGEEGSDEERRWAMPDLVIVDGGKGQVSAAAEVVLDELGLARPAARRSGQGTRGAVPARSLGPDPAARRHRRRCTSSSGSATRPIGSRSPTTANLRDARRPSDPRSTTCPGVGPSAEAGAPARVRVGQAGARGAGRADRRGARASAGARGADQGDPRGVTRDRLGMPGPRKPEPGRG